MTALLGALFSLYLLYLLWEAHAVRIARKKLAHVVHVNGTRGKSTVSRLIEAGLRAGGLRVFCKTTGTDPMTIDVNGREELICRRGKANIKEQIAGSAPRGRAERAGTGGGVHGPSRRNSSRPHSMIFCARTSALSRMSAATIWM